MSKNENEQLSERTLWKLEHAGRRRVAKLKADGKWNVPSPYNIPAIPTSSKLYQHELREEISKRKEK